MGHKLKIEVVSIKTNAVALFKESEPVIERRVGHRLFRSSRVHASTPVAPSSRSLRAGAVDHLLQHACRHLLSSRAVHAFPAVGAGLALPPRPFEPPAVESPQRSLLSARSGKRGIRAVLAADNGCAWLWRLVGMNCVPDREFHREDAFGARFRRARGRLRHLLPPREVMDNRGCDLGSAWWER